MNRDGGNGISSPSAKYLVERMVGEGGMKSILRAFDSETGRDVAMAVMNDPSSSGRQNFVDEAILTARLEHPNIVPIHEIGTGLSGEPYFTMKLLRGVDLAYILDHLYEGDRHYLQRFPLRSLLEIFLKVCDAVAFAHSKGIIHLDLKPDNIQVGEYGEVLVLDWGLAKKIAVAEEQRHGSGEASLVEDLWQRRKANTTVDGVVKGTPAFMAPEQAAGSSGVKDQRTDIYALGAILYALMTFRPPVSGASSKELISNVLHSRIIPARSCAPKGREVPAPLEFVAYKAMDHNPDLRYQSVNELKEEIESYLAGFATMAEDAGLFTQLWLLLRRNRSEALLLASAVFVIVLLASFLLVHLYSERARAERALASLKASEARNEGLVERMSQESRREWRLLFAESFNDKYVNERWSLGQTDASSISSDGISLSSSGPAPVKMIFREKLPQDSIRLLFECSFKSLASPATLEIFLQGGSSGEGYSVKLGGAKSAKASILKGQRHQPLAEAALSLPEGRLCQVLVEIVRGSDGARLRLELDGREVLSAHDPAPPPLNPVSSFIGFSALSASLSLHDLKLYALDAPMKAELLDIATRHLNKGNFSTAADLFGELVESSPDPKKRELASEGLQLAKLLEQCKSKLPEWRAKLERAWPDTKPSLSIDTDGFRVELESQVSINLAPLKGLPISTLKLRCPKLSDLSPLKSLPLLSLDIASCSVRDLSPLEGMALKHLRCDGNPISSLAPLKSMSSLTSLSLEGCSLSSLDQLRELSLSSLNVSSNSLTSLDALSGMPLETLECSRNPIAALTKFKLFTLKSLEADSCSLADLTPLRGSGVESLSVDSNKIASLEPLRGMPLKALHAQSNLIEDLSPLKDCHSLEHLSVAWNRVSSLAPLYGLKLKSLSCDGNAISSLTALQDMDSLTALSAQRNSLQDISALSKLFSLSELDLSGNPLHAIDALDSLSLDRLFCGECPIDSFGKALAFPPRRIFILDRTELSPEAIEKLSSVLGSGPYGRELEKSLGVLAAYKRGDAKALKESAFEVDGRLFCLVPSMKTYKDAADAAASLGGHLPDKSSSERLELLAKRFSSPFWADSGLFVDSSGVIDDAGSPRRLLPLLIEWQGR